MPSEVAYLERAARADEDVAWLDVAVGYAGGMHCPDAGAELPHQCAGLAFGEGTTTGMAGDEVAEAAGADELLDKEHVPVGRVSGDVPKLHDDGGPHAARSRSTSAGWPWSRPHRERTHLTATVSSVRRSRALYTTMYVPAPSVSILL